MISPEEALAPGAPQLHENVPGNLALEVEAGDAAAVEAAFAQAAHVTRLKVEVTRVAPNPMEPRACIVAYDARADSYTLHVCMQGITTLRRHLSVYTGVPEDKLHFEARDVGGGFGQRTPAYPEYCALMIAAKQTGRPVKWVSTRSEGFASDTHGRANIIDGALALDREGRFLAMRLDWVNDMGAYLSPASHGPHPQHHHLHDRRLSHSRALRHLPGRADQHQRRFRRTAARGVRTSPTPSSAW